MCSTCVEVQHLCTVLCAAIVGTMADRQRYAGTPKELASILGPAIRERGRSFVDYDEAEVTSKSRTDSTKVKDALPVLLALREADPRMCFKKTTLRAAIQYIVDDFEADPNWQLRQEDVHPYLRIMSNRVSNLVYTVKQAEIKHPDCKWVASLPWRAQGEGANSSSSAPRPKPLVEHIYGYDKEIGRAWRSTSATGRRQPLKEYADEILKKDSKLWASWADGDRWEVSGVSMQEFEDGARPKKTMPPAFGSANMRFRIIGCRSGFAGTATQTASFPCTSRSARCFK